MRKKRSTSTKKITAKITLLQGGEAINHPIYKLIYEHAYQNALYLFQIPPENSQRAMFQGFSHDEKKYLDKTLLAYAQELSKAINTPVLMPAALLNTLIETYNNLGSEPSDVLAWLKQFIECSKDDELIVDEMIDFSRVFLKILDNLHDCKLIDNNTYRLLKDHDALGKARQEELKSVFGTLSPETFRLFLPILPAWSSLKQTTICRSLLDGFYDWRVKETAAMDILCHPALEIKSNELLTYLAGILDAEEGLKQSSNIESWLSLLPVLETNAQQRILKLPLTNDNLTTLHFLVFQLSPLLAQTLDVLLKPNHQYLLVKQLTTINKDGQNPLEFAKALGQTDAVNLIEQAISQLSQKYRDQLNMNIPEDKENRHRMFKRKEHDSLSPIVNRKKPSL